MDDSVKAYMAKIGAKGGAAGKGTEKRKRLNKRAAKIRWRKAKENQWEKMSCVEKDHYVGIIPK